MEVIYLVKRTDDVGYDEYDAIVVRAKTQGEARHFGEQLWGTEPEVEITRIFASGKPEYILKSYCAG